ncbi:MAG: glycosyltransferase family 2 protein [Cellulomonadaceae bacterium]|nr:glycosyltransferase family 2 protein [Cellulomonadaceae bacterium]
MSAPVSVLCPTFNRSTALRRTLESVLAQDNEDLELLVGSDGSTDDTHDVVRAVAADDARVRLLPMSRRADPGLVRADLARRAQHDVLAYVDHDDTWRPDHLSTALDQLGRHDAVVLTSTYQDAEGTVTGPPAAPWHAEVAVLDPYAEPTRVVHRRRALDAAGGWRAGRFGLEDWDLWWRMARTGTTFRPVDEPTSTVALAPSSRRWSLPDRAIVVLAGATSNDAAHEAVRRWVTEQPDPLAVLDAEACRWSTVLARDPATLHPVRGTGRARGGTAPAPGPLRGTWLGRPRVQAGGPGGWLVAVAAPIVSLAHRREAHGLLVRSFPEYLRATRTWFAQQPDLSPVKELDR